MGKHNENITIWIIEDNQGDAFLLEELLVLAGFSSKNITIYNKLSYVFENSVTYQPDIIMLDLFLPDSTGIDTFRQTQELLKNVPIIIMSGLSDTEIALKTVQEGAQDFLLKGNSDIHIIEKSIHYSIERKKNIQQLTRSEQEYRLLFEASPLPIFMIDSKLTILQSNCAFYKLYGYDSSDIDNLKLDMLLERSEPRSKLLSAIENQHNQRFKHLTKNGELIYVEQLIAKTTLDNKEVYTIIVNNETEKHLFEQEKLRLIAETLEDERGRYARELHDGLAQQLVALGFYISNLEGISAEADSVVKGCQEIIKNSLDQTRAMCYNLTPPELEKGLIAGLKAMFQRLSNFTPIQFDFHADTEIELQLIENTDEYALYRIIQEFVNNSIKHSNCSTITCNFSIVEDQKIIIDIIDNGSGFEMEEVKKGLGLKNMEYRALAASVTFELTSIIGTGSHLKIIL